MATHLTILTDGRVRQTGTPHHLYNEPADLWTARFLGDANILDGTSDGSTTSTPLGVVHHPPVAPGPVTLVIRPEHVHVVDRDTASASATVRDARYFGHDSLLRVELDGGLPALVRLGHREDLLPGTRIHVAVNSGVRAFPAPHHA